MSYMREKKSPQTGVLKSKNLFTLEVCLLDGPITEQFANENETVTRIIQIRGESDAGGTALRDLRSIRPLR